MGFKFAVGDRVRIVNPDSMAHWTQHRLFTAESRGTILECRGDGVDEPYFYAVQWDNADLGEWFVLESEIALDDGFLDAPLTDAIDRCIAGEIVIRVDSEEEKRELMAFAESNNKMSEGCSPKTWEEYKYTIRAAYSDKITFSGSTRGLPVVPFSSIQELGFPDLGDLL